MTFSHDLPDGYDIRELTSEEFGPFFAEYRPQMFGGDLSCMPDTYLSEQEKAAASALAQRMGSPYRLRLGVFHHGTQVGWSFGYQVDRERFYMGNSAVFPEHRRKGLYRALLERIIAAAKEQGFQMITSRHIATNSPIIIAKLQSGFVITGSELCDTFGFMVNLTYFTNPQRRRILDFRAGKARPDVDLLTLFGIKS